MKGYYLCGLESIFGQRSHFIGIGCTNKCIYDSLEEYLMELTKDNLDKACGDDQRGIKNINMCWEIISKRQKLKTKNDMKYIF